MHHEGVGVNDFSKMDLLQVAEARPRCPLQFDWPDCLFASNSGQMLRRGLESSVLYKPTGSDQVDPCSAVRSITTVFAVRARSIVCHGGVGCLDLSAK